MLICFESFELCDELVLITQLTPQLCPQPLRERSWTESNNFTSLWSQQFKTPACPRTRAQPRTSHNYPGGDENAERTGNLAAEIDRTLNPTSYRLLHVALRQESNGGLVCRCKLKRNIWGKKASFDFLFVFPLKWPKPLPHVAVIMLWLAPLWGPNQWVIGLWFGAGSQLSHAIRYNRFVVAEATNTLIESRA